MDNKEFIRLLNKEKRAANTWAHIKSGLRLAIETIHEANKKWWIDLHTDKPLERNVGEMLMLIVSEIAEAMEGHRKNLMDDKLTHRKTLEVELADAMIRIFDLAGGLGLDLPAAIEEKCLYNAHRLDHTPEHRKGEHGKKY
jgi:NTP pyrophosphatase (non-canonical NTP hydrolase)